MISCAAGGRHNLVLALPDNSDSDRAARMHSGSPVSPQHLITFHTLREVRTEECALERQLALCLRRRKSEATYAN